MGRLRITGAWVGVLDVEFDRWTVSMLKDELAKRSNSSSNSINLISEGRLLKESDGNPNLAEIGFKNNAKVLFSRIEVEQGQFGEQLQAHELRSAHFDLLKKAVTRLASRQADSPGPYDDYSIELTDQSGLKLDLDSKIDKSSAMMGLLMHRRAKQLMREKSYKDAIEVLKMGEEAFSLCDPEMIKGFCNVHFLQIDMVWCYFMLRDISFLSDAGGRIARASKKINLSLGGKDAIRARLLQGGCSSEELALCIRLELLYGVIAYHSGKFKKCRRLLNSAQEKLIKLQVSDEALSLLMSMGYEENEVKRALQLNNQNVERAVDFLIEEREKEAQKHADNIQRKKEIKFECEPAAESLLLNENDTQKSLDNLTDPELNFEIQLDVETRKRKRIAISDLVSMGFERSRVLSAVAACGSKEEALEMLLPSVESGLDVLTKVASILLDEGKSVESSSSSGESEDSEQRDAEAENKLAARLQEEKALPDFDIDATIESEAIKEYLARLPSSSSSSSSSFQVKMVD